MSTDLKVGDKIRVKYWKELPNNQTWNPGFFELNSGRTGQITEISWSNGNGRNQAKVDILLDRRLSFLLQVLPSEAYTINLNALEKVSYVPEHLFKI